MYCFTKLKNKKQLSNQKCYCILQLQKQTKALAKVTAFPVFYTSKATKLPNTLLIKEIKALPRSTDGLVITNIIVIPFALKSNPSC